MAHLMNPWGKGLMDNCYFIHLSLTDCYIRGGYFHTSFTDSSGMLHSIMHTHTDTGICMHTRIVYLYIAALLIATQFIDLWMDRQANTKC